MWVAKLLKTCLTKTLRLAKDKSLDFDHEILEKNMSEKGLKWSLFRIANGERSSKGWWRNYNLIINYINSNHANNKNPLYKFYTKYTITILLTSYTHRFIIGSILQHHFRTNWAKNTRDVKTSTKDHQFIIHINHGWVITLIRNFNLTVAQHNNNNNALGFSTMQQSRPQQLLCSFFFSIFILTLIM